MALTVLYVLGVALLYWVGRFAWMTFYNSKLHPLASFPGPFAVATGWYKAYEELYRGKSWHSVLQELHVEYGPVVRVGPNELHFSHYEAYHDIYNNINRWDKEESLYHSFGEDNSSFGFLTYKEAKQRKDVMAPFFSKRSIHDVQSIVREDIDRLCAALTARNAEGKSSDMLFGLRCFTLDTIVRYCFAKDVHATEAPDFRAPMVVAMDASLPAFPLFRQFGALRRLVFSFPGWLTKLSNPALSGLIDLQDLLGAQVAEIVKNPKILEETPHPTIYHRLLDPEANKAAGVPSPTSLYEEAQALMFGGAESSGNVTMLGIYHILQNPAILKKLKAELLEAWPLAAEAPSVEELEKLPYLTAVIKESLRMSPSVPSPLPRVVPATGATISGMAIPGGTVVGMSLTFVHFSEEVFENATTFFPERWLRPDASTLEKWFVPFSKGPRACIGITLAMVELCVAFATLFRRFDMKLDGTMPEDLAWRECFLPSFNPNHMRAFCSPVSS